ncbi:MAG: inorganic pyrophosphatase [Gammaproteobacteria bacterium RIFCSPHIGHO2_12_FULL_41_15]|nr:MAG: inorganic pyrophosphatase [Gammaproteobacteria bacterium RIFCSPHIGHO2_12_FULL_41_15]
MSLSSIVPAKSIPDDFNVIIEIPSNSSPVKYEVNKDTGLLEVDRLMTTAMYYPCNYGFVPNTLSGDGDPVDVLVVSPFALQSGCLVRVRALGMLAMEDEAGEDNKIIAVPIKKICRQYAAIETLQALPESLLKSLEHFFEHYKDLEEGKWVKISGWKDLNAVSKELTSSIERYRKSCANRAVPGTV